MVLLIIAGITSSCVRERSTGPQAWIDSPRGGASIPLGVPITVVSHAYAREGIAEIVLYVNGEAYHRAAPAEAGASFSEFGQEWLPPGPGEYTIQVMAFGVDGTTSDPDHARVLIGEQVADAQTAPDEEPSIQEETPDTPTPIPDELPPALSESDPGDGLDVVEEFNVDLPKPSGEISEEPHSVQVERYDYSNPN